MKHHHVTRILDMFVIAAAFILLLAVVAFVGMGFGWCFPIGAC